MREREVEHRMNTSNGLKNKTMSLATGLNKLNIIGTPSFDRGLYINIIKICYNLKEFTYISYELILITYNCYFNNKYQTYFELIMKLQDLMTLMEKLRYQNRPASYIQNVKSIRRFLFCTFSLDVAESSIDLTQTGHQPSSSSHSSSEDVARKTTLENKRKQSKISKGLMEFISMGDPIGYADKKITK